MYVSKNLIENPTQVPDNMDPVLYARAVQHYTHFRDNQLWYVDEDRTRSHVFYDGLCCVEVSPKYVRFLEDTYPSDFTLVNVHGTDMIRHKRSIKPLCYYPNHIDLNVPIQSGNLLPAEERLFEAHPELVNYCLYNRGCGWTIDLCDNTYPIEVGVSASLHVNRVYQWFKAQHNLVNIKSKSFRRRVSSLRFDFT